MTYILNALSLTSNFALILGLAYGAQLGICEQQGTRNGVSLWGEVHV